MFFSYIVGKYISKVVYTDHSYERQKNRDMKREQRNILLAVLQTPENKCFMPQKSVIISSLGNCRPVLVLHLSHIEKAVPDTCERNSTVLSLLS